MKSKMTSIHEAIIAEFNDYKMHKASRGPNAWFEHMDRIRALTNAKMRILDREPEGGSYD